MNANTLPKTTLVPSLKCYLCHREGKNKCYDIFKLDDGYVCDTCPFTQKSTAKNSLQKWCQKNKLEFPKYDSKKIGGTPNEPEWESVVTVDGKSYRVKGCLDKDGNRKFTKKVDAETYAALKALREIYSKMIVQKVSIKTDKKVYILIDIENLQTAVDDVFSRFDIQESVEVHVFHSKNVKPNMMMGVMYHEADSFHRDAADTLLILFIGGLLVRETNAKIIVLTKDHFGAALSDICKSKYDITVCNDADKIVM